MENEEKMESITPNHVSSSKNQYFSNHFPNFSIKWTLKGGKHEGKLKSQMKISQSGRKKLIVLMKLKTSFTKPLKPLHFVCRKHRVTSSAKHASYRKDLQPIGSKQQPCHKMRVTFHASIQAFQRVFQDKIRETNFPCEPKKPKFVGLLYLKHVSV